MNKTDVLIIGAGPTGLFCAHQLGIIGLSCEIVDNLDKAGGQCIELYPDKPIYDIPAVPECTGEELTNNLLQQIKPFNVKFHLNERVEELKKVENRWHVKTSGNQEFDVAAIIIAGGVGSFEPRKFSLKECEKFRLRHEHQTTVGEADNLGDNIAVRRHSNQASAADCARAARGLDLEPDHAHHPACHAGRQRRPMHLCAAKTSGKPLASGLNNALRRRHIKTPLQRGPRTTKPLPMQQWPERAARVTRDPPPL